MPPFSLIGVVRLNDAEIAENSHFRMETNSGVGEFFK